MTRVQLCAKHPVCAFKSMDAGWWDWQRGEGNLLLLPDLPWGLRASHPPPHPTLWYAAGLGMLPGWSCWAGRVQVSSCVRSCHVDVRASLIAQLVKNLQYRRPWVGSQVGKIPWRKDRISTTVFLSFPGGSDSQESTCNTGDLGLIPELGRSPGGGHGNPL